MKTMEVYINPGRDQWPEILERPQMDLTGVRAAVSEILERVKSEGDRALTELTLEFDGVRISRYLNRKSAGLPRKCRMT